MPPSKSRDLYLNITGSSDGLTRAAKAGRASLAELGAASGDLQQIVADNFKKLAGGDLQQSARQIESTLRSTLTRIRAQAQQDLGKPLSAATIANTNVAGAQAELERSQAVAASYRELADAQARVVATSPTVTAGQRELAVALEVQALKARDDVGALEQQLATLETLRGALGITAAAEEEVTGAHTRMGVSGMILQHVVRSTADSFAAGLPVTMIFAEQIGRLGEAAATVGGEGSLGAFGKFMGGPWGLAITSAVSVASVLGRTLLDDASASDEDTKAKDGLKDAVDRLAGAQASLNHETRQGIIDDIDAANATRQRAIETRALLAAELQRQIAARSSAENQQFQPGSEGSGAAVVVADNYVTGLQKQLAENQKEIDKANAAILTGTTKLVHRDVEAASDPRSKINQRFEDQADALDRKYQAGGFKGAGGKAEYDRQYAAATAARDSALDALKPDRQRRGDPTERARQKGLSQDISFTSEEQKLQQAYLEAAKHTEANTVASDKLSKDMIEAQRKATDRELTDRYQKGEFGKTGSKEAQANLKRLQDLNEATAAQKTQNVDIDRTSAKLDDQFKAAAEALDAQLDYLKAQQGLATTTSDRRRLAEQILTLEQQKAGLNPQHVLLDPKSSPEDIKRATDQQAAQRDLAPLQVRKVANDNLTPLEEKRRGLVESVGDINTDLQTIEVDSIDSLTSALGNAWTQALHLHGALGDIVGDITKMFIQREIELPIVNALAPKQGASSGGGGIGSLLKRAAGLFGLGGGSAFKNPSTFFDTGFDAALGSDIDGFRAGGGSVGPNQTFEVGEHGPELLRMGSTAGMVIPHAVNDVSPADMRAMSRAPAVQLDMRVQEGALFRPVVSAISSQHAAVAQQNATNDGAALAEDNRMWMQSRQLGSGS